MNYISFAKINQVSAKKKPLKNTRKIGKSTGKVREFCQSGKMGTLLSDQIFPHSCTDCRIQGPNALKTLQKDCHCLKI